MSLVDLLALGLIAITALGGFRRGLVVGVLSLAGLIGGAYAGARVGPDIVGAGSQWLPVVALGGAMLAAAVGQSLGGIVGRNVRSLLFLPPLRLLDRIGGGVLGIATGLVVCWVVGAVLLYTPGQTDLRQYAQESTILSALNKEFPPQRLISALARVDPFGRLAGPRANVDEPDLAVTGDPHVRRAAASVFRITGNACGLGVEGSGWLAAPGLVVTNAHVVAGIDQPNVDRRSGKAYESRVVAFDRKNDVAVLRVPGLRGQPLPFGRSAAGSSAVILGYPENGPFTVTPVRLGATVTTVGRDAYGKLPTVRSITTMRGEVRSGNSGGPVLNRSGHVVATVFARRVDGVSGYGVPNDAVRRALDGAGSAPLETSCADR